MEWIKKLSDLEIEQALEGDLGLVYQLCGKETALRLLEHMAGLNIYVSGKTIKKLQRLYIKKYYNGNNIKKIASELKVSERYVYNVIGDDKNKD